MKEHKIEILCQMEDERDSPVEHCNAGPGSGQQSQLLNARNMLNIQSGIGAGLSGILGGLFDSMRCGPECPFCRR